jgi:hypothetical protein
MTKDTLERLRNIANELNSMQDEEVPGSETSRELSYARLAILDTIDVFKDQKNEKQTT